MAVCSGKQLRPGRIPLVSRREASMRSCMMPTRTASSVKPDQPHRILCTFRFKVCFCPETLLEKS
eukprot:1143533-Pelagomonas_calceolata.AAC.5